VEWKEGESAEEVERERERSGSGGRRATRLEENSGDVRKRA
jgi:hypothetical protein